MVTRYMTFRVVLVESSGLRRICGVLNTDSQFPTLSLQLVSNGFTYQFVRQETGYVVYQEVGETPDVS